MTIKQLREILNDLQNELDNYDDEQDVRVVTNTYFLGNPKYFLGISGYDGGYISFDELVKESQEWGSFFYF